MAKLQSWPVQNFFNKLDRDQQAQLLVFIKSDMKKRKQTKQITEEEYLFQTGSGLSPRAATGIAVFQNRVKDTDPIIQWTVLDNECEAGEPGELNKFLFQSILLVSQRQKDILGGPDVTVKYYLALTPNFTKRIVKFMEVLTTQPA